MDLNLVDEDEDDDIDFVSTDMANMSMRRMEPISGGRDWQRCCKDYTS